MLRSLHIENYVLIDSLDVSFPEGLIIVTGQTGAGKSILLGAMSLLSGAKADAANISSGADSCVVEAEFTLAPDSPAGALLEANDIEWGGGELTVRRVIHSTGRSRAFVNDCPVPLPTLVALSAFLFDIHSQHASLLLADKAYQLSALDSYAGNKNTLLRCSELWSELLSARRELTGLEAARERLNRDRDYNEAQFKQLDAAHLKEGELEELEEEQKQLANAEEIKASLSGVEACFMREDGTSLDAALKEASKLLERLSPYLPSAKELAVRLDAGRIELNDILSEVSDADARVSLSPQRLEQVEDRMSLLYSLLKKYSCNDVAGLIETRDRYAAMLSETESADDSMAELKSRIADLENKHSLVCRELSESRKTAAVRFAGAIQDSLRFLELEHSVFEVSLSPCAPSSTGSDEVSFLFSSSGKNPVDVSRCASGGELSRIMLCLKALMASYVHMPTLVFDEIDTGVSGSVADKMGTMICSMGKDMQVLSITHLPQVAAKGDAHYIVSKTFLPSGQAVSSIHKVEGEERVNEIARMLSGSTITAEAVANAKSLLRQN